MAGWRPCPFRDPRVPCRRLAEGAQHHTPPFLIAEFNITVELAEHYPMQFPMVGTRDANPTPTMVDAPSLEDRLWVDHNRIVRHLDHFMVPQPTLEGRCKVFFSFANIISQLSGGKPLLSELLHPGGSPLQVFGLGTLPGVMPEKRAEYGAQHHRGNGEAPDCRVYGFHLSPQRICQ